MKTKLVLALVLSVALVSVSSSLWAHHGNAAYQNKVTELKQATVTAFAWSNPHSLIEFDVKDNTGKIVHWTGETASPEALQLVGWSKTSLQPGDVITVFIYGAKTGAPVGRLNKVVLKDGTVLHDTQLGGDAGNKSGYGPDEGGRGGNAKQ